MNNNLISRDALKEDFKSRLARCDEWIKKAKDNETRIRADATKHFICEVIMTIDNAPTVERPQGKWIEESSEIGALGIKYTWIRCNRCGWDNSLVIPKSFCPNCGADMRREAENE